MHPMLRPFIALTCLLQMSWLVAQVPKPPPPDPEPGLMRRMTRDLGYFDASRDALVEFEAVARAVLARRAPAARSIWEPKLATIFGPERMHELFEDNIGNDRLIYVQVARDWAGTSSYSHIVKALARTRDPAFWAEAEKRAHEVPAARRALLSRIAQHSDVFIKLSRPLPAVLRATQVLEDAFVLGEFDYAVLRPIHDARAESSRELVLYLESSVLPALFDGVPVESLAAFADLLDTSQGGLMMASIANTPEFFVSAAAESIVRLIIEIAPGLRTAQSTIAPMTATAEADADAQLEHARAVLEAAPSQAVPLLRAAVASRPAHAETLVLLAEALYRTGRKQMGHSCLAEHEPIALKEVLALVARAEAVAPLSADGLSVKVRALVGLRKHEEALAAVAATPGLVAAKPQTRRAQGDALLLAERSDEALQAWSEALFHPDARADMQTYAFQTIARCHGRPETWEDVKPVMARFVAKYPDRHREREIFVNEALWSGGEPELAMKLIDGLPAEHHHPKLVGAALVGIAATRHLDAAGKLDATGRTMVVEGLAHHDAPNELAYQLASNRRTWKGLIVMLESGYTREELEGGESLVAVAANAHNEPLVRALAARGFDVNRIGSVGSALRVAAYSGDLPMVRALLELGALFSSAGIDLALVGPTSDPAKAEIRRLLEAERNARR